MIALPSYLSSTEKNILTAFVVELPFLYTVLYRRCSLKTWERWYNILGIYNVFPATGYYLTGFEKLRVIFLLLISAGEKTTEAVINGADEWWNYLCYVVTSNQTSPCAVSIYEDYLTSRLELKSLCLPVFPWSLVLISPADSLSSKTLRTNHQYYFGK